jgi:deazaflavin-dependent oxidoreductase (nitroreductase family)
MTARVTRRPRARAFARRLWNAGAWIPRLADRRGLRWLLSGRLVGAPILILTHRGRRTGRTYRTPVEAIVENAADGEVVISPMRGRRGDWYRNVLAGGLVEVNLRGERFRPQWRELSPQENRDALRAYKQRYPIYGSMVLRMLMGVHGLLGDPVESIGAELPMLALRREEGP